MKIAVVQGGPSSEAEVSRTSSAAIAKALESRGHEAIRLELDKALPATLVSGGFDVVFPIVHGVLGEDGSLQGLLELLEMPYVGSGVMASAIATNKVVAKRLFRAAGLPVAEELVVKRGDDLAAVAIEARRVVGRAVVVKPGAQGSSIGVTRVKADEPDAAVVKGLEAALAFDDEVLIERFVVGREVTCGVTDVTALGGARALPPTEIKAKLADFYDFASRYATGGSEHICPPDLPVAVIAEIQRVALAAHRALGCRDLSRADFVVGDGDDAGRVTLLEVNTLPGFTGTSLYPEAMGKSGYDFATLCDALVSAALARPRRREVYVAPMPA